MATLGDTGVALTQYSEAVVDGLALRLAQMERELNDCRQRLAEARGKETRGWEDR